VIGDAVEGGVVREVLIGEAVGACVETLADEEFVATDDVFATLEVLVAIISATASSNVRFVCLNNTRIKMLPEVSPKDCSVVDFSADIVEY